jgi:hypothetical protein
LRQIIPYERLKLAAIEVTGDQVNPMRVKPDLTKITDEEPGQLEKIVLKVGTGVSGGHDGNADQAPARRPLSGTSPGRMARRYQGPADAARAVNVCSCRCR